MKRLILSSFVMAALGSLGLGAQATPDFSGTWTMDLTRSEAAAQGTPIGPVTVAIRQTPDEVHVETTRNGMTEVVRYLPAAMKPAAAGDRPERSVGMVPSSSLISSPISTIKRSPSKKAGA